MIFIDPRVTKIADELKKISIYRNMARQNAGPKYIALVPENINKLFIRINCF